MKKPIGFTKVIDDKKNDIPTPVKLQNTNFKTQNTRDLHTAPKTSI